MDLRYIGYLIVFPRFRSLIRRSRYDSLKLPCLEETLRVFTQSVIVFQVATSRRKRPVQKNARLLGHLVSQVSLQVPFNVLASCVGLLTYEKKASASCTGLFSLRPFKTSTQKNSRAGGASPHLPIPSPTGTPSPLADSLERGGRHSWGKYP